MRNKSAYLATIILLTLSTLACGLSSMDFSGGSQLSPNILFQDDFSDSSSGWNPQTSPEFEMGYKDDGYVISIKAESTMAWANPGLGFSDVTIETDATRIGGTDDNSFGIFCRYSETEAAPGFYFFVISSDGFYAIGKMLNGHQELISSVNMEYNEAIQKGNLSNHLQADCIGDRLVLNVNGQELANVTDSSLSSGDVGLIAGAFSTLGTEIFFDNFVVKKSPVASEE